MSTTYFYEDDEQTKKLSSALDVIHPFFQKHFGEFCISPDFFKNHYESLLQDIHIYAQDGKNMKDIINFCAGDLQFQDFQNKFVHNFLETNSLKTSDTFISQNLSDLFDAAFSKDTQKFQKILKKDPDYQKNQAKATLEQKRSNFIKKREDLMDRVNSLSKKKEFFLSEKEGITDNQQHLKKYRLPKDIKKAVAYGAVTLTMASASIGLFGLGAKQTIDFYKKPPAEWSSEWDKSVKENLAAATILASLLAAKATLKINDKRNKVVSDLETTKSMLDDGKYRLEEIADICSRITNEIQELEEEKAEIGEEINEIEAAFGSI